MSDLTDKALLELIEIAIGMSSYTSGSLCTTWQIFIQRYPHKEGDGFAEGESAYEIGQHGQNLFGARPAYKTLRDALVAFIQKGLDEQRERLKRDEEESANRMKSADDRRARITAIEALIK